MTTSPRCEYCNRELPKREHGSPGRVKRFCSDECRLLAFRFKKTGAKCLGHNLASCNEIDAKTLAKTISSKAQNGHPNPPIDLLGRGWRGGRKHRLEPSLIAEILHREVCASP
jgi:hypothetical protein